MSIFTETRQDKAKKVSSFSKIIKSFEFLALFGQLLEEDLILLEI